MKARKLLPWLWLAVVVGLFLSLGAVGCRSTKSSGGNDSCGSGCTGH